MTERNVYRVPEDRVLLRTADVYQTEAEDDVASYSDRLLAIVADFRNSGRPEGANAQSMAGKSKRGEVACRLFARIDPETGIIEAAGFKTRGCLAMTACASAACILIEGKPLEEALDITIEDIRTYVDGVPAGKVNALHFAVCAVRGLVGDFLLRDGASLEELEEAVSCDPSSLSCIMAEHCSYRQSLLEARTEADERRRAQEEENACARLFELVRKRSRQGKLTGSADWGELVPAHLLADEFAERVFARLGADAAEAGADALATDGDPASPATVKPPEPSPFANRGVGIPVLFGKKTTETEKAETGAGQRAQADDENGDASEGSVAASGSESVLDDIPHVFDYSHDAPPSLGDDDELVPPEGYALVEVDGQWGLVKTDEPPRPKALVADAAGIKVIRGDGGAYLYDGDAMTPTFARWAFLAQEDDPLVAFAYCVREDSRVYPRPMARSSFANEPLSMDAEAVEAAWRRAKALPAYADIHRITASNGDVYFYSSDYLGEDHAASLAEWASVERFYNV